MKKVEIALVVLAIAALVLRVNSVQGSVLLSGITFGALALFYLLLAMPYFNKVPLAQTFNAVAYREREIEGFQRFWAVVAGFIFCLALLGILFVLNYWKAAFFFWCLGMFFTVPVAALSWGKYLLQSRPFYKAIAIRAGVLLLVGLGLVVAEM